MADMISIEQSVNEIINKIEQKNVQSLKIFNENVDGRLHQVVAHDKELFWIFEKTFTNSETFDINAGYYFIQLSLSPVDIVGFQKIIARFEKYVYKIAKGNFREVTLILLTKRVDNQVIDFVESYNHFQQRKPIEIITTK